MDLKLTIFFLFFPHKMVRGYEEVSSSQARRRRGVPRETPTASSMVAAMSIEELKLYNQAPVEISLEMLDDLTASTIGEADNVIYFTREQFVVELRFPIPSCTRTPKCFLDSNGLQCAKLSLPVRHLADGDLFHLYFEAWD